MEGAAAVEAACVRFEHAKNQDERREAEQVLLDFKRSLSPYATAQAILTGSNNPLARFHALAAMRTGLAREWPVLTTEQQRDVPAFVVTFLVANFAELAPFVRKEAATTIAVAYKRGLLEPATSHLSQTHLDNAIALVRQKSAVGVEIVRAILAEMGSSYLAGSNVPWAFHEHARKRFETHSLRGVFEACLEVIRGMSGGHLDHALLAAMLAICQDILSWEYSVPLGRIIMRLQSYTQKRGRGDGVEYKPLRPKAEWKGVLVNPDVINMFFALHGSLRQAGSAMAHTCRQCLIQFVSLHGDVFKDDPDSVTAYYSLCIAHTVHMTNEVLQGGINEATVEELVDISRMLLFIVRNHRAGRVLELSAQDGQYAGFLPCLLSLLQACLVAHASPHHDPDTRAVVLEAVDIQLDGWMLLADAYVMVRVKSKGDAPHPFATIASAAFEHYCTYAMHAAALTARDEYNEFADESAEEERLDAMAALGRVQVGKALAIVSDIVSSRTALLHAAISQGHVDTPQYQVTTEELCVGIELLGHVMADKGRGERPCIPDALVSESVASAKQGEDSVVKATTAVFRYADLEMQALGAGQKGVISPFLARVTAMFLARWARSYLLPDAAIHAAVSPSLWQHYGADMVLAQHGNAASHTPLAFLLRKVMSDIVHWHGEEDVIDHTSALLIQVVRRKEARTLLANMPEWQELVRACTPGSSPFSSLSSRCKRRVVESVVRGLTIAKPRDNKDDGAHAARLKEHFSMLADPLSRRMQQLMEGAKQADNNSNPAYIKEVLDVIDVLRGIAHATEMPTHTLVHALVFPSLDYWCSVATTHHANDVVCTAVIKLYRDFVDTQLFYLSSPMDVQLVTKTLHLLQSLAHVSSGSHAVSKQLAASEEEARESYVRQLLHLVGAIVSGDTITIGERSDDTTNAQVVLYGLQLVMGMVTESLLSFPDLCNVFFETLALVCQMYPEQVCALDRGQFSLLLDLVMWGIESCSSLEPKYKCFDCLLHLCAFHLRVTPSGVGVTRNVPALELHLQHTPSLLASLLHRVLTFFVLSNYDEELLEGSSALLALILCDQQAYMAVVQRLIESQPQEHQPQWHVLLGKLLSSNNLTPALDKRNKATFQKNLQQAVIEARCIVGGR